ncbi:unnamed protein product [Cuscuta campestris]|uniref:Uncharacterized protein n=1 Tax=Cuscuta campestris TaxID=132261 RepID=A0A484NBK1_9ASTE|nr:unnamed protein product [Cuscuta campestris]
MVCFQWWGCPQIFVVASGGLSSGEEDLQIRCAIPHHPNKHLPLARNGGGAGFNGEPVMARLTWGRSGLRLGMAAKIKFFDGDDDFGDTAGPIGGGRQLMQYLWGGDSSLPFWILKESPQFFPFSSLTFFVPSPLTQHLSSSLFFFFFE